VAKTVKQKIAATKPVGKTVKEKIAATKPVGKTVKQKIAATKPVGKTVKEKIAATKPVGKTVKQKIAATKPVGKTVKEKIAATKPKRTSIKAKTTTQNKQNKPNKAQQSIGANKAKRSAITAAKRGTSSSGKATPMDVEREAYRQSRGGGQKAGNGKDAAPRRSGRVRVQKTANGNGSNKTVADQKVKKRNAVQQKKQVQQKQKQGKVEVVVPTKKAIGAAKYALSQAGYQPPKGMKMVVSFVENTTTNNGGKKQNVTQKQKVQNKIGNGYQRGNRVKQ
jgi:predicted thioesterase